MTVSDKTHLQQNLRLLCGYSKSVSDICRRAGISRPQFVKYLNGRSFPSYRSIQRICDHFGLEDWEILLPREEFRELIRAQASEPLVKVNPFKSAFESELWDKASVKESWRSFLGYYYSHFVPKSRVSKIQRSLVRLFEADKALFVTTIEREVIEENAAAQVTKFDGVAYHSGHRLYISERERFRGETIWHTTLYATTTQREQFYSGLTLGSTSDSVQDIAGYRSIFQYLGQTVNLRQALKGCGLFSMSSPEVPIYIRDNIENRIEKGDNAFVAA